MEPINCNNTAVESPTTEDSFKTKPTPNPLFPFMGIGCFIYALLYTFLLYKNGSGITYPFFVGGTCFFFFLYLKKSGITAKKTSLFPVVSLLLLGISTCMTDSWILILLNKTGIFFLFFYLVLHNLYEDKKWDIPKFIKSIICIVFTSISFVFYPFTDSYNYIKIKKQTGQKENGKYKYIFFGVLIALFLLCFILPLLVKADAVFSNTFQSMFSFYMDYDFCYNLCKIIFLFLFAYFASYCILSRISLHNLKEDIPDKRTGEPVMGITFTGIISFVYLIFCYIQIVYLFGGMGTLPENYTYSSYAREGFFQLVFVCLINLGLVLVCLKRFKENKILKGILVFISFCTFIMIASSFYRMLLYIEVYYLTFLRVFVLWSLFVIFLLMTDALVFICKNSFPFTKYCLMTVTIFYLLFSFSHPDYWIAKYNLNHSIYAEIHKEDNKIISNSEAFSDFDYLIQHLSLDAAPAIFQKADEFGYNLEWWFIRYGTGIVRKSYNYKLSEISLIKETEYKFIPKKLSIRKWNLSKWKAYSQYITYYKSNTDYFEKINNTFYSVVFN